MTDLEIIRTIEGEIGVNLNKAISVDYNNCEYCIDENANVTAISITHLSNHEISETYKYLSLLTHLSTLYLDDNDIWDITPLKNFPNIVVLSLDGNRISDLSPLMYLTQIEVLYLEGNNIRDLRPIQGLTKLFRLHIGENSVTDLSPLQSLMNLNYLDIKSNAILNITPLQKLVGLSSLYLSNNIISDFSPLSYLDSLLHLDTAYNPAQEPPLEIVNQGIAAIKEYFKAKKKQGAEKLYEAKIVIVGAGESGKTTLIRKLQDPAHPVPNTEDKRTEGIRVTTYPFRSDTAEGPKEVQAHIWDFGGQELYHTTHQLFLTPDTLYILLNDNRKNDTDFYYWLNIVTLRAGDNCPIIMVFNAKDNSPRQIIPGEEIFTTFSNLVRHSIDVNFADEDLSAILQMKNTIERHFSCLDVLGKPFPAYWVKVREALGKIEQEYIKWDQFADTCKQNGIDDLPQMKVLATTLHNLGVLLYFPDVFGLKDLIILSSQWCIDAIYSALDIGTINKNGGRFNEQMLAEKWSVARFAGNELQLLKLMQHFDLCYRIDSTNEYIAPQLLPIEEHKFAGISSEGAITFRFDYTFMPAGLITRLIARMSRFIKSPYVWRTGVTLEWEDGTIAEVTEHQLTHQIVIKINGPERQRRLAEIRKTLHDLHKDFRGMKFEELVSCNCADCMKGGDVTTFPLEELEDDAAHNDEVTCRNGRRKKVAAKDILQGISYEEVPRVFISYSHKNEAFKNEFRAMIKPLEREGHWKVWDDRWLLPGDEWNGEILRYIEEANVIVLMLTKEFFASDYIYDVELGRAIKRHEAGDALVIGIVVSDCMWEITPLSKIQMLPKDAVPIEKRTHKDEVWKAAADTIVDTIKAWEGKTGRKGGWNR